MGGGVADECLSWPEGDDRPARWAEAAARGDLSLHGMFFVLWKDTYGEHDRLRKRSFSLGCVLICHVRGVAANNVTVDVANRTLCRAGGFPAYGVAKG